VSADSAGGTLRGAAGGDAAPASVERREANRARGRRLSRALRTYNSAALPRYLGKKKHQKAATASDRQRRSLFHRHRVTVRAHTNVHLCQAAPAFHGRSPRPATSTRRGRRISHRAPAHRCRGTRRSSASSDYSPRSNDRLRRCRQPPSTAAATGSPGPRRVAHPLFECRPIIRTKAASIPGRLHEP